MPHKDTVVNFNFKLKDGTHKDVHFDLEDGKEALYRFLLLYQPDISYADLTRYIESKYDSKDRPIVYSVD